MPSYVPILILGGVAVGFAVFTLFVSQLLHSAAARPFFLPRTQMASLPESRARGDVLEDVQNLGPDVLMLREGGSASVPQPRAGARYTPRPGGNTTTGEPIFTRLKRSIASSLVIRMHPEEIARPMYSG